MTNIYEFLKNNIFSFAYEFRRHIGKMKFFDPRKKHRCNCNSKELRKTHYSLGQDSK